MFFWYSGLASFPPHCLLCACLLWKHLCFFSYHAFFSYWHIMLVNVRFLPCYSRSPLLAISFWKLLALNKTLKKPSCTWSHNTWWALQEESQLELLPAPWETKSWDRVGTPEAAHVFRDKPCDYPKGCLNTLCPSCFLPGIWQRGRKWKTQVFILKSVLKYLSDGWTLIIHVGLSC